MTNSRSNATRRPLAAREIVVLGPWLPPAVLARARQELESRFCREEGRGHLVVHLRPEPRLESGFDVVLAYLEADDRLGVRREVSDAFGLGRAAPRSKPPGRV